MPLGFTYGGSTTPTQRAPGGVGVRLGRRCWAADTARLGTETASIARMGGQFIHRLVHSWVAGNQQVYPQEPSLHDLVPAYQDGLMMRPVPTCGSALSEGRG